MNPKARRPHDELGVVAAAARPQAVAKAGSEELERRRARSYPPLGRCPRNRGKLINQADGCRVGRDRPSAPARRFPRLGAGDSCATHRAKCMCCKNLEAAPGFEPVCRGRLEAGAGVPEASPPTLDRRLIILIARRGQPGSCRDRAYPRHFERLQLALPVAPYRAFTEVTPIVPNHVSTNSGQRVIADVVGRRPNAWPPLGYRWYSTETPAFFKAR